MKDFFMKYGPVMILMLPLIIFIIVEWRRGKKDLVWKMVFYLVCQAEQQFGSGTGPAKLALVWTNIYATLPLWLRIWFPKKVLDEYILEAVACLTDELKDPNFNLLTFAQEIEAKILKEVDYKPLK